MSGVRRWPGLKDEPVLRRNGTPSIQGVFAPRAAGQSRALIRRRSERLLFAGLSRIEEAPAPVSQRAVEHLNRLTRRPPLKDDVCVNACRESGAVVPT